MQPTILIVDDEKHTRDGLRRLLEDEYDVYVAEDIGGAISVLERETVDLLLTDLRLAGEDGMQLIERALKMPHPPVCIMMTAYGSVDTAVEAMKRGAYDFVTKPLNLDKVEMLIARALQSRRMEQENRVLRQQIDDRFGLENILGESLTLREVLDTIRQVAPSSANVLIEGESGTGKELAAHAICGSALCGLVADFAGKRIVRARARRLYRRARAANRTVRTGEWRHHFSGRDRRDRSEHTGEIVAGNERATRLRTRWWHANLTRGCKGDCGNEQEPGANGAGRKISR
jgi:FixJ family two-component response regulator